MAIQLLIRIADGPAGSGREKGQIIRIQPVPNRGWHRREGPPTYKVIQIDDIDYSDPRVSGWARRHHVEFIEGAEKIPANVSFYVRSAFKLQVENIAAELQTELSKPGVLSVASDAVIPHLKDVVAEQRGIVDG